MPLRGPGADLIVAVSGLDMTRQRSLFEVPDEVAYFNTASLAPPLRSKARQKARAQLDEFMAGDGTAGAAA